MKKTLLIVVISLIVLLSTNVFAEGEEPKAKSRLEEVSLKTGTFVVKQLYIGTITTSTVVNLSVTAIHIIDETNGENVFGVTIQFTIPKKIQESVNYRPRPKTFFLDYDEIDPLLKVFESPPKSEKIGESEWVVLPRYHTKSGLRFQSHNVSLPKGRDVESIALALTEILGELPFQLEPTFMSFSPDDQETLKGFFVKAKEQLDAIR